MWSGAGVTKGREKLGVSGGRCLEVFFYIYFRIRVGIFHILSLRGGLSQASAGRIIGTICVCRFFRFFSSGRVRGQQYLIPHLSS